MSRNQVSFYATKGDLQALLLAIEAQRPLQFVAAGLFDSPSVEGRESLLDEPDIGTLTSGDPNHERRFLIADREVSISVREVPQRRGGVKYAVDQQSNPKTVAFVPGGSFGPSFLLAGQVGTISADPSSINLYESIRSEIRRMFTKIKTAYVGPEAEALLDAGWRLTASSKTPAIYDLKRQRD